MSGFAKVCICGRRALPGTSRCAAHPVPVVDEAARLAAHPERAAYSTAEYRRNSRRRHEMTEGHCEACGEPVTWEAHETHHMLPLDHPETNRIENLRNACKRCHKQATKANRRARRDSE